MTIANYTTSVDTTTFQTIVGQSGTIQVFTSGTIDDTPSTLINIGFDFVYNGVLETQFYINPNGYLTFGGSGDLSYDPISNATPVNGAIVPFGTDLFAASVYGGGNIYRQTTGALGSQILTVEWQNFVKSGYSINVQAKLYEADYRIEFVYGTWAPISELSAGANDYSFNTKDTANVGANNTVNSTAIQSDGKIIIGGSFTSYNRTTRNCIARLNTDGTLDTTFNVGSGANLEVYSMAIQSDGKIIIGGLFLSYNGTGRNRIARLNSDGSLDTGFNVGNGANSVVNTVALQSDGKIIIGGSFTSYNGTTRNRIARLNTDGTLDTGFNPGTGASSTVNTVAIQSDGKIIIGGAFSTYNETARNRIARLNADGTLDTGFNVGTGTGTGVSSTVSTVAIQSDGKIIIGGDFTTYNGTGRNRIARLNTDGTLDTTFLSVGNGASSTVNTVAIQSDGKIIIGGGFTNYNSTTRNRIARLNTDGSLDTTFLSVGVGASSTVNTMAIQSDGKIIIGGLFTTYNGTIRNYIARLNADGALDATFLTATGASSAVVSMAIQSDGKIIIGGVFTTYNGTTRNRIARLNTDGTLDTDFNVGSGANSSLNSMALQSDGKIIIGGGFTTYNGIPRTRIARILVSPTTYSFTGQVGLRGATNLDYKNFEITTDWSNPLAGSTNTDSGTYTANVLPISGTLYRFQPELPPICFHPDSQILVNGQQTLVHQLKEGDQLIDEKGLKLTITRLHVTRGSKRFVEVSENMWVTIGHQLKKGRRVRKARLWELPIVTRPSKITYHIETDGPNEMYFIPVNQNGDHQFSVEVWGQSHRMVGII